MVLSRLKCVVMLTVVALLALCMTAKVVARASGAEKTQLHGQDTVPYITLRRRWPVRLLMPSPTASAAEKLAHSLSEKKLLPDEVVEHAVNQAQTATHLFNTHKVKDADIQTFFKSPHFINWEKAVKAEFGDKAEELIFSTMSKEFNAHDNVAIEAIIAHAIEDPDTRDLGIRFEDLLLDRLVDGVSQGKTDDMSTFLRYLVYRGSSEMDVLKRMETKMDANLLKSQLGNLYDHLNDPVKTPFQNLEEYFEMISGGRKAADVFQKLHHVDGFNNDAFLFEKLYERATKKNVDYAEFMLATLREARVFDDVTGTLLPKLKNVFTGESRKQLLDPIIKNMPVGFVREHNDGDVAVRMRTVDT